MRLGMEVACVSLFVGSIYFNETDTGSEFDDSLFVVGIDEVINGIARSTVPDACEELPPEQD
jgi:hypothetical protein